MNGNRRPTDDNARRDGNGTRMERNTNGAAESRPVSTRVDLWHANVANGGLRTMRVVDQRSTRRMMSSHRRQRARVAVRCTGGVVVRACGDFVRRRCAHLSRHTRSTGCARNCVMMRDRMRLMGVVMRNCLRLLENNVLGRLVVRWKQNPHHFPIFFSRALDTPLFAQQADRCFSSFSEF